MCDDDWEQAPLRVMLAEMACALLFVVLVTVAWFGLAWLWAWLLPV